MKAERRRGGREAPTAALRSVRSSTVLVTEYGVHVILIRRVNNIEIVGWLVGWLVGVSQLFHNPSRRNESFISEASMHTRR